MHLSSHGAIPTTFRRRASNFRVCSPIRCLYSALFDADRDLWWILYRNIAREVSLCFMEPRYCELSSSVKVAADNDGHNYTLVLEKTTADILVLAFADDVYNSVRPVDHSQTGVLEFRFAYDGDAEYDAVAGSIKCPLLPVYVKSHGSGHANVLHMKARFSFDMLTAVCGMSQWLDFEYPKNFFERGVVFDEPNHRVLNVGRGGVIVTSMSAH